MHYYNFYVHVLTEAGAQCLILREHKSTWISRWQTATTSVETPEGLRIYMQFVHLSLYPKVEWGAWAIDFGSTA